MNLSELVEMRGFTLNNKIKLVRHKDSNYDIQSMYRNGFLDFYQSTQIKDVFGNCEYIMSFLGDEGTKTTYIGTYKKLSTQKLDLSQIPNGYPITAEDVLSSDHYYYEFEKIDLLADLIDRLVIEWGKSTRSWFQWLSKSHDKNIVEILPPGYVSHFPGYDEVFLNFSGLEMIINHQDSNRVWYTMLGSVAGVYLIVDTVTGLQYVGSAYGEEGILGRWKSYVKTKHGGNKILVELLEKDPNRYQKFQSSILHTADGTLLKA